jgi:hypothetical protein
VTRYTTHLCDSLPGRLWSSPPQCRLRSPPQTTAARYPASVGRAGLPVLGKFSHLPRSRRGGPHGPRRPAFVRNPVAPTRGFEIGRCPATRSGQRQETAHCAAARRNHGGAAKLSSSGTAPDQLAVSVHLAKRSPTRAADDAGWTPFPISPSSIAQHGSFRQSAPISTLCTIPDYASLSSVKWLCALVDGMFSIFDGYLMRHSPGGGDHSPLRKASSSSSGR